jgi:hypothetical protein
MENFFKIILLLCLLILPLFPPKKKKPSKSLKKETEDRSNYGINEYGDIALIEK